MKLLGTIKRAQVGAFTSLKDYELYREMEAISDKVQDAQDSFRKRDNHADDGNQETDFVILSGVTLSAGSEAYSHVRGVLDETSKDTSFAMTGTHRHSGGQTRLDIRSWENREMSGVRYGKHEIHTDKDTGLMSLFVDLVEPEEPDDDYQAPPPGPWVEPTWEDG